MATQEDKPLAAKAKNRFAKIDMPEHALWGEQTQRSLQYFNIGQQRFSPLFIETLVRIKRTCAQVNCENKHLSPQLCAAIKFACDEVIAGRYSDQFPLRIWQTGSGTQTNMNVNEVLSKLAQQYLEINCPNENTAVHPNDHVNMSQSSNDVFPTAMHITVAQAAQQQLLTALTQLNKSLAKKQDEFKAVHTVGRTHLMDALPMTVGEQLSAYCDQLAASEDAIYGSLKPLYQLAIGGTAVGSGANAPDDFGQQVAAYLAAEYLLPFKQHPNLFAAVSCENTLLRFSGALKQLASVLLKMANDFRLLGSGPRCGFNEWRLPANEPGSSIMPGKVNPTQCEALSMVCLQVFGNDLTVSLAASQGQLQLNVYRPVIIHNVLESIELLSDAMVSFAQHCVDGLMIDEDQINSNLNRNLSAITLLAPKLGYDLSSKIVYEAYSNNISLAEAAENLGHCTRSEFAELMQQHLLG